MPVRDIFCANPHIFSDKVSKFSLHCSQDSLFFPSNTITIILMNLFCTSCSWFDSSHLRQKSASRVRVESFGEVGSFFVLDSSSNLETRACNPLRRLAYALGNTSEIRALIGCFQVLIIIQTVGLFSHSNIV
jgi:uncharacterized Fe-S radical SAM superfamily protein PflX